MGCRCGWGGRIAVPRRRCVGRWRCVIRGVGGRDVRCRRIGVTVIICGSGCGITGRLMSIIWSICADIITCVCMSGGGGWSGMWPVAGSGSGGRMGGCTRSGRAGPGSTRHRSVADRTRPCPPPARPAAGVRVAGTVPVVTGPVVTVLVGAGRVGAVRHAATAVRVGARTPARATAAPAAADLAETAAATVRAAGLAAGLAMAQAAVRVAVGAGTALKAQRVAGVAVRRRHDPPGPLPGSPRRGGSPRLRPPLTSGCPRFAPHFRLRQVGPRQVRGAQLRGTPNLGAAAVRACPFWSRGPPIG